jgi:hypothetical protein
MLSIKTDTLSGWYCDSCCFVISLAMATQEYGSAIDRGVLEAFEKHDCANYPASAPSGYFKTSA